MKDLLDVIAAIMKAVNNTVSGIKTLDDNASTHLQTQAGIIAIVAAAANVASVADKFLKKYPGISSALKQFGGVANALNLKVQIDLLNEAIASGDSSKIIQASLGLGSSVAALIGYFDPLLKPEADAIALLLTSAGAVYKNRGDISQFLGTATTQINNLPSNPFANSITGSGRDMPGQPSNSTIQYTELISGNGIILIYTDGVTYTDNGTTQQWSVPDGNGNATTYTRDMVGGFAYGDWQVEQIPLIGAVSSSPLSSTPTESITLTKTSGSNPFITGTNVTSALPGNNLTTAQAMALAEATGTPVTFADQSATVTNGNCYTCNLDLSAASGSDQTITLTLKGGANNIVIDGSTNLPINFSGGTATITVPAGQSSLQLTIIDGNNVSTADLLTLTATITGANGSVSNNLNITFNDPAPTAASGNVITGSARPTLVNSVLTPVTIYYADGSNDQISAVDLAGNGLVSINGGAGNDVIIGNGLQDVIIGGNGNNQIYGTTQMTVAAAIAQQSTAQFNGQKGELIAVGDGNNTIIGSNGNDDIFTGVGNNTIVCGAGTTFLGSGVEVNSALMNWSQSLVQGVWQLAGIYGGSAPFTAPTTYNGNVFGGIPVGLGNDTIYGGTGNSVYLLSNGTNWLNAGGGNDLIQAGVGINIIYAGIGNDTITGGGGSNYINLESGNDIVALYGGKQTVIGGTGNDTVYAGDSTSNWANSIPTGKNVIQGGSGNNTLYGSGGNDSLISGSVSGTGKVTTIEAGNGKEYIEGGGGNDTIEAANDFEWRMQA
jgi:Ca2+-binding RTX toxin-like protein